MYAGKLAPVYIQIPGVPGTRFHPGSIMLIYRLNIFAVVPFSLFPSTVFLMAVCSNRLAIAVQFVSSVMSWSRRDRPVASFVQQEVMPMPLATFF